jgi:hypothetical protein
MSRMTRFRVMCAKNIALNEQILEKETLGLKWHGVNQNGEM